MEYKKLLFLYGHINNYILSNITNFINLYEDYEVHIIFYSIDKNAPFVYNEKNDRIIIYHREHYNYKNLCDLTIKIKPLLVYCYAWTDISYLKIIKLSKNYGITTVLGLDNPWKNQFRQRIACFLSRFILLPIFNYVWVAGDWQYIYANRLGFNKHNIFKGQYSCDSNYFNSLYTNYKTLKQLSYPKTLLYLGRFLDWKGVKDLYNVFMEIVRENKSNGWKLYLIGDGPLKEELKPNDNVFVYSFVQTKSLENYFSKAGFFCLPSYDEHWGVVVHEAVSAGLPLLLSDEVGSSTLFLKSGVNGFLFKSQNKIDLKNKLLKIFDLNDKDLINMSNYSNYISKQYDSDLWCYNLFSMINKWNQ